MQSEINLHYNNLNQLTVEENIKDILTYANSSKVNIKIADCCYIISKNKDKNLQISLADPTKTSDKQTAIINKLNTLLNIKQSALDDAINDTTEINNNIENKNLDITEENNFSVLASEKLQSIDKLTNLLTSTKQETQEIFSKFESAKKQGGAYANAILTDEDLIKEYNEKLNLIKDTTYILEIENNHLKKIKELYQDYCFNIDKNDTETQKTAYNFACSECHYLDQQTLMTEVAELSKNIVSVAQKNNATIVLPGRSLIACAAYIEKNYPHIEVIKMPLSGLPKIIALENSKSVNKIYSYITKYLDKTSKTNNLLVADYIESGKSLSVIKGIIDNIAHEDRVTYIAVYSKYSAVKSKEELLKINTTFASDGFDYFFQAGNGQYSPVANALHQSTFDEISPYGKYELTKIIAEQPEPHQSADGFNLLKKLS